MNKLATMIFSAVLSVATLVAGSGPALADSTPTVPTLRPGLSIKVAGEAAVGQPVVMIVYDRKAESPVAGAEVYGLSADRLSELITSDRTKAFSSLLDAYTLGARSRGLLIGTTDANGQVTFKFEGNGRYIIFAVKDGFIPGFARISIKDSVPAALRINAPNKATVKQPFRIQVTDRGFPKHSPVEGASVFALRIESSEFEDLPLGRDEDERGAADRYAAVAREKGIPLGKTDVNGIVVATFEEMGLYVLVAVKDGYIPAFSRVQITPVGKKPLQVHLPQSALVNEPVIITVFEGLLPLPAVLNKEPTTSSIAPRALEKNPNSAGGTTAVRPMPPVAVAKVMPLPVRKPVQGAEAYAITPSVVASLGDIDEMKDDTLSKKTTEVIATVKKAGVLIGTTDANGQVKYAFPEVGRYLIVAVKDGYLPGRARIGIVKEIKKQLVLRSPGAAIVKQPVTMRVGEKPQVLPVPTIRPAPSAADNPPTATQILKPEPSLLELGMNPVADASIYALPIPMPTTSNVAPQLQNTPMPTDEYIAMVKAKGVLLGKTDADGKLVYAFGDAGRFYLIAIKDGYLPAFAKIEVQMPPVTATPLPKLTPRPSTTQ